MKHRFTLLALTFLSSGIVIAQNEDDALRYSMNYFGGTARNISTAGALSAMGGDFGNASQNPAGLGRLTKSNFSFTANLELPSSTASFYGTDTKDRRAAGNVGNFSYVKAYTLDPNRFNNWYSVQLGIGVNRIKSFNDQFNYTGAVDSSILHSFISEATGTPQAYIYDDHPFTAGLAYDVYAMDPGMIDGEYTTQFMNGKALHNRTIERKGGITEFNLFTLSGNYANKLLVGASFNFMLTNYVETLKHLEAYSDSSNWLNSTEYTGLLDISGKGLNVRVGAIYMPVEQFRIGLAVETPTLYWMYDYWTNDMKAGTDSGDKFVLAENVPSGSYKYKVRTPFKANLSAAYVLKKFGTIGGEVEYVDYANAKLKSRSTSSAPYSFAAENTQIDNIYKPVFNYKVGLEARVTQQFYVRAGYAQYGTPYKEASGNSQNPTSFFTGGVGYNFGILYLDAAYQLQTRKEEYYAYDPTLNGSMSEFDVKNSQLTFSIGARF